MYKIDAEFYVKILCTCRSRSVHPSMPSDVAGGEREEKT